MRLANRQVYKCLLRPNRSLSSHLYRKVRRASIEAGRILDKWYLEHKKDVSKEFHNFSEMRVQHAIIQFQLCSQMSIFLQSDRESFSGKLALSSCMHIIYEYHETLRKNHLRQIYGLAVARRLPLISARVFGLSKRWRRSLAKIQKYKEIRNKITGHFDPSVSNQIQAIESISSDEVLEAFEAFMHYKGEIIRVLKDIGVMQDS